MAVTKNLPVFGSLLTTRISTTLADSASCPYRAWIGSWTLWAKEASLFNLVSSFHQITTHKDTVPPTAFCFPTGLLRVAGYASALQRVAWLGCQGP